MSADLPERDPLADLVSRSIGARIESVDVEVLPAPAGRERKRLRFSTASGATTAIFERAPRGETLEAQLLPFLARKTDRVPIVHSRGLPPPRASLGPWILIEDVFAAASGCDGDPLDVLEAKRSVERAVANDVPALKALGVAEARDLPDALARAERGLVHGDLCCANARRLDRGVILAGWQRAFIGPLVLDVASLARDLAASGRASDADRVRTTYIERSGLPDASSLWFAAARTLEGGAEL